MKMSSHRLLAFAGSGASGTARRTRRSPNRRSRRPRTRSSGCRPGRRERWEPTMIVSTRPSSDRTRSVHSVFGTTSSRSPGLCGIGRDLGVPIARRRPRRYRGCRRRRRRQRRPGPRTPPIRRPAAGRGAGERCARRAPARPCLGRGVGAEHTKHALAHRTPRPGPGVPEPPPTPPPPPPPGSTRKALPAAGRCPGTGGLSAYGGIADPAVVGRDEEHARAAQTNRTFPVTQTETLPDRVVNERLFP